MKRELRDVKKIITLVVILAAAFQYIMSQPQFSQIVQTTPTPQPSLAQPTTVLGQSTDIDIGVSAKVTKVVDGDTIRVSINGAIKTVRLIGINTPETVDPRREVQCFGKEASNKAKELLQGQTVTLESDVSQGDTDKYQRLLRYVFLNGLNINQQMITEGFAYEYTYDVPYKYQDEFKRAQIEAQTTKKGLWAETTCKGSL